MPHPTTTFYAQDALDRLHAFEVQLDLAFESNVIPHQRVLAICIAGNMILNNVKQIPAMFFSPIEQLWVESIAERVSELLNEFGDSLIDYGTPETGTPTEDTPVDPFTRPYPEEDDCGPFPPNPPKSPEDMTDEEWDRESNWGCW